MNRTPYFFRAQDLNGLDIYVFENLTRRRFIIGASGLLGAVALGVCGAGEEAAVPTITDGMVRIFPHARGTTNIPVQPQRVVLTNDFLLNPVLAADYTPIASGGGVGEKF